MKMDHASILVVDDSPDMLEVLHRNLCSQGYRVFTAPGVAEAVAFLKQASVDLVITDLAMPKISGLDLVRHVRENLHDTAVMMITGYATVNGAVKAVKTGAEDYLSKPFTDEELLSAVGRVIDKLYQRRLAQHPPDDPPGSHGLVGDSPAMRTLFSTIDKSCATAATVLIDGESGVGKELVARAIHHGSDRTAAPFVPINCGAIPKELIESELFGHARGAFTGASDTNKGLFQAAHGGTVFLDEVSEMSPFVQVKLLRVLQDGEVRMVGSSRPRRVDVRIVAATNRDLTSLVERGTFRQDLYYRLSVIQIAVPPLRDRSDDVLLLTNQFGSRFARQAGKPSLRFTDEALAALKNYAWPGNVRELENLMQRLVVMTEGDRVDVTDLPELLRFSASRTENLSRTLAEVEAEYVNSVLGSVGGNKTRAAKILGIDRKTLREKLKGSAPPPHHKG